MRKLLLAAALLLGLGTLSGCHLSSLDVHYSDHGPRYSSSAHISYGSGYARRYAPAYAAPTYGHGSRHGGCR